MVGRPPDAGSWRRWGFVPEGGAHVWADRRDGRVGARRSAVGGRAARRIRRMILGRAGLLAP